MQAAADAIRESLDKGLRIYLSLLTEKGDGKAGESMVRLVEGGQQGLSNWPFCSAIIRSMVLWDRLAWCGYVNDEARQRLRQNVAQRFGIKRCRGLCGQQIY
jgi:hypothetical protein